mmetsp:Transcript_17355/g.34085  ORF Transcript_17355/g.34085 Transcript_17355/m.34085 type:complete len:248 (-) Transcript_17355:1549-2292(-)
MPWIDENTPPLRWPCFTVCVLCVFCKCSTCLCLVCVLLSRPPDDFNLMVVVVAHVLGELRRLGAVLLEVLQLLECLKLCELLLKSGKVVQAVLLLLLRRCSGTCTKGINDRLRVNLGLLLLLLLLLALDRVKELLLLELALAFTFLLLLAFTLLLFLFLLELAHRVAVKVHEQNVAKALLLFEATLLLLLFKKLLGLLLLLQEAQVHERVVKQNGVAIVAVVVMRDVLLLEAKGSKSTLLDVMLLGP